LRRTPSTSKIISILTVSRESYITIY